MQVFAAFESAEKVKKAKPTDMFEEVYDSLHPELIRQKAQFIEHVKLYKEKYSLEQYEKF